MDFHLLRRNYEADPADICRGMWLKVRRAPPPCLPTALSIFWKRKGFSLIGFLDEFDRMEEEGEPVSDAMRDKMMSIIADMCRPLERPRRSRRRKPPTSAQACPVCQ
jgi:hypothetical protein